MTTPPESRRSQLAGAMLDLLLSPGEAGASFRSMAAAAGVSRPTLVHHFGDRDGAIAAALIEAGQRGRFWVDHVATLKGPPYAVLHEVLSLIVEGWRRGPLARLHRLGLSCGLQQQGQGSVYLEHILEPTLLALEGLLQAQDAAGELLVLDARISALRLFSPVLVALLHQDLLGGGASRPLDLDRFMVTHVAAFVAEHRRPGGAPIGDQRAGVASMRKR